MAYVHISDILSRNCREYPFQKTKKKNKPVVFTLNPSRAESNREIYPDRLGSFKAATP